MDFKKIFRLACAPRYMFLKGLVLFLLLGMAIVLLSRPSLLQNHQTISLDKREVVVSIF